MQNKSEARARRLPEEESSSKRSELIRDEGYSSFKSEGGRITQAHVETIPHQVDFFSFLSLFFSVCSRVHIADSILCKSDAASLFFSINTLAHSHPCFCVLSACPNSHAQSSDRSMSCFYDTSGKRSARGKEDLQRKTYTQ